jgi:hypothetical protein
MAAGGVARDDDAAQIEWILPGQLTEVIDRRGNIEIGSRPAPTLLT